MPLYYLTQTEASQIRAILEAASPSLSDAFASSVVPDKQQPPDPLTKTQRKTLDFLVTYIDRDGVAPTIDEIAAYFGISPGSTHERLGNLQNKGYIKRDYRMARSLRILHRGPTV